MDSLVNNQIPLAEPYQWDEEEECSRQEENGALAGSHLGAAVGTGLARIQRLAQAGGSEGTVSDGARNILTSLLQGASAWDYGVDNTSLDENGGAGQQSEEPLDLLSYDIPTSDLVHSGAQSIIDLAKEGRLSLFCSILRLFRNGEEVSTPNIIRACSHAIRPADVPPDMDAKETVMAALHFLSSSVPELEEPVVGSLSNGSSLVRDMFPCMPILFCTNADDNLDRRCYMKHVQTPNGNWSMGDTTFHQKVIRLERAFMASTVTNPSRLRMCPRVEDKDAEAKLMASGTLPAASKAKGGGSARKK